MITKAHVHLLHTLAESYQTDDHSPVNIGCCYGLCMCCCMSITCSCVQYYLNLVAVLTANHAILLSTQADKQSINDMSVTRPGLAAVDCGAI